MPKQYIVQVNPPWKKRIVMRVSAELSGRRRWIWGTHIGHKILLQRCCIVLWAAKKKKKADIQRNDMGEKGWAMGEMWRRVNCRSPGCWGR